LSTIESAALSGSRDDAREQAREMQRRRLLDAMAQMAAGEGFRRVTVGGLCARAAVSPSALRELFGGLDGCFLALLERVMERSTTLVTEAFEAEPSWQDGVLAGLEALLVFLDSEPVLARICLVEALAGPHEAAELRMRLFAALRPLLDRAREQLAPEQQPQQLAARATVALVVGVLQEHLLGSEEPAFIELLGDLTGLVVAQYLGISEARGQAERGNARAEVVAQELTMRPVEAQVRIPKEIRHARAQRRRLCLAYLAENPGASNQAIAVGIELSHLGQLSTALSRLDHMGLLVKQAGGAGRPNAWWLSPYGEQVARSLDFR
jgi:AcrR family transcriptional regulator